jgi:hypothetical protein
LEYLSEIDNYESEIFNKVKSDAWRINNAHDFAEALNSILATSTYPVLHNILLIGGPNTNKLSRKLLVESERMQRSAYYDSSCMASANSSRDVSDGVLRAHFPVTFKNFDKKKTTNYGKGGK